MAVRNAEVAVALSADPPEPQGRPADGAAVSGVLQHPIRWFIAALLGDRPMSANELAELVELKPSAIRRHLREMRAGDAVEVVEVRRRRGTAEQVYGLRRDFIVDEAERAELSLDERRRIDSYTLKVALGEALRSLVTNPTSSSLERLDACVTRVPMVVDEEGWTELAQIHLEAFEKVMELRDRVEARLEDGEGERLRATSLLLCFEVSPPS